MCSASIQVFRVTQAHQTHQTQNVWPPNIDKNQRGAYTHKARTRKRKMRGSAVRDKNQPYVVLVCDVEDDGDVLFLR